MTTPILGLTELIANQSNAHIPVNSAVRAIEMLAAQVVKAKGTTTPPGSPSDGDAYIVGSSATGAWSGWDARVAFRIGGAWSSIVPKTGMLFRSEADGKWWQYTGSAWSEIAIAGASTTLAAAILADSPTGFWKLDETSGTTAADSSGNGYNLTYSGSYTLADSAIVPSDDTKRVRFESTGKASATTKLGTSPPLTGDWTIEVVAVPYDISSSAVRLLSLGASGETEAANYQFELRIGTNLQPSIFWEYSAGTDQTVSAANGSTIIAARSGVALHLVVVKDGTANTLTFYVNGVKVSTASYSNEPSGGTDAAMTLTIGAASTMGSCGEGPAAFYAGTKLSEVRIRAHARAAGFIR